MHQRVALHVVQEEIAIVAVAERGQDAHGFFARGLVVAARIVQMGDRMRASAT
jgi:hypothetical protein